jgi:hypothetical protein
MQGLSFLQGEEGQSRFRGVAESLPPDEIGHLITCESSSSLPCSTLAVEGDPVLATWHIPTKEPV